MRFSIHGESARKKPFDDDTVHVLLQVRMHSKHRDSITYGDYTEHAVFSEHRERSRHSGHSGHSGHSWHSRHSAHSRGTVGIGLRALAGRHSL